MGETGVKCDCQTTSRFLIGFTTDMAGNLQKSFNAFADDNGVVKVEVNSYGLWLTSETGVRLFLGKATTESGVPEFSSGEVSNALSDIGAMKNEE